MSEVKKTPMVLVSGQDAADPETIIAMFTAIRGRPPTDEELTVFRCQQANRKALAASKLGRPASNKAGGFGIVGGTVSRPPEPAPPKPVSEPPETYEQAHARVLKELNDELADSAKRHFGWVDKQLH